MIVEDQNDKAVLALAPLHWSLVKIKREWDDKVTRLEVDASEKMREIEVNHRDQRRALAQRLGTLREAVKATIPLNGRLTTIRASRDNLIRLGRAEEAEKVRLKLDPLERFFWTKALAASGFTEQAKREKEALLGAQQAELASLGRALRRDSDRARQARDAEVKVQQRKNRCSSDNVWSIWCAAKSGETQRLVHMLALPKADVDARDLDSGWTALHFASRQGKLEAVEVLVEQKAFVGARGPNGRTPLHLAAGWGTYEVCFALLRAGADKNVLDRDDKTAQHLAESKKRDKIALLLGGWKPMGLTATQTQKIIESRGDGPQSPWETEADPEIRAQLRVLDMQMATFGEKHPGASGTLNKLGGICREAGRLKDAKQHLERLVELLQTPKTAEDGSRNRSASNCYNSKPSGELGTLAMALGNLGVVCHELGEADRASETLEESLKSASFLAASSASGDAHGRHLLEAATRNLGLHYLSEGNVNEARPVLRAYLNTYEENVRSDMPGGDESIDLIPPLTLLSYADMLAGDHAAASAGAERAQTIATKCRINSCPPLASDPSIVMGGGPSNPIPRLEWMGVQRFAAGEHDAASKFFAEARALVLQRLRGTNCSNETGTSDEYHVDWESELRGERNGRSPPGSDAGRGKAAREGCAVAGIDNGSGGCTTVGSDVGEFHPEAMRLDRCAAVAICRRGPEAF